MVKRLGSAGYLAAAFLFAVLSAAPLYAADDTQSNYQLKTRNRELPVTPGGRIEPIGLPTAGDDDMPNRTARPQTPIPQASALQSTAPSESAHQSWYLSIWQQILLFGSRAVFFMKA